MMAIQYNLPKRAQDCVFIGGLLHDISKVLMHYNTGNDNKAGANGQHESFSFMVLAEHLKKLKQQDKNLFEAMSADAISTQLRARYCFCWAFLIKQCTFCHLIAECKLLKHRAGDFSGLISVR